MSFGFKYAIVKRETLFVVRVSARFSQIRVRYVSEFKNKISFSAKPRYLNRSNQLHKVKNICNDILTLFLGIVSFFLTRLIFASSMFGQLCYPCFFRSFESLPIVVSALDRPANFTEPSKKILKCVGHWKFCVAGDFMCKHVILIYCYKQRILL